MGFDLNRFEERLRENRLNRAFKRTFGSLAAKICSCIIVVVLFITALKRGTITLAGAFVMLAVFLILSAGVVLELRPRQTIADDDEEEKYDDEEDEENDEFL